MSEEKLPRILQMLDDISRVVNSLDDSQQALDHLVKLVTDTMGVANCSIMLIDPQSDTLRIRASQGLEARVVRDYRARVGEGIAGWVAAHGESLLIPDIDKDPRFRHRPASRRRRYMTRSLLSVPLVWRERVAGVLNVNNRLDGSPFDEPDKAALQVVARFVTIALERARMREIGVQKELMDAELRAARRIQEVMLPSEFPRATGLEIGAVNLPAKGVAGDFYDVIASPGGKLWALVGDVCGKGLPAALYMVRVLTTFRLAARHSDGPSALLAEVNQLISGESTESTLVTAAVMMFDEARETVTVATAGHQAPLLYRGPGEPFESLDYGDGLPLGVEEDAEFSEVGARFARGHLLFAYTDGVTEARNARGRFFGPNRLEALIRRHGGDCAKLLQSVVGAVRRFAGSDELKDDLTVVAVRRAASPR